MIVGPRAARLDEEERARIVVRRSATAGDRPRVAATRWHRVPSRLDLRDDLMALPVPIPAADGAEARALVCSGLSRCWASSLAALDAALRRRVQRGEAMLDALDRGVRPTRAELRHWVLGDDATQLAFPEFVVGRPAGDAELAATMRAHLLAVRRLRERIAPHVDDDTRARAAFLQRLRARHGEAQVVAFTSYGATADALWRALRSSPGVAQLTGRGARTASGPRPRADILRALDGAHPGASHDRVSLVIATDVLSEGVNLQGVSVIVHLDQPWTPAALEQRAGRAARIGARHATVHVHAVRAPRGATALLRHDALMAAKQRAQRIATDAASETERLRALVAPWLVASARDWAERREPAVATVTATRPGWLAVLDDGPRAWLTSHRGASPRALVGVVRAARGDAQPGSVEACARAIAAVRRSIARADARALTDADGSPARRTLLRRVDACVTSERAATRALLAEAASQLRAVLGDVRGAGVESEIECWAREPAGDPMLWMARTTLRLRALARPGVRANERGASIRPRLVALLILQPARAARHAVTPASAPRSRSAPPSAPTTASP
ncbi:MAG: SWF/SNF helicase family protein [Gemmatimonadetes bacterium]|nr:SWF/SNF helicase family protein [Gemmatimonadota bacterium]